MDAGGDRLRRLIGFESAEELLLAVRFFLIAQAPVAKHACVVHLQVFGIDARYAVEHDEGLLILPFTKQDLSDFVEHDTIARVLAFDDPK